jgi:hypothetical protein
MKINTDLLLARGFNSEKELNDFLNNCVDESWVKELKEFYGLVNTDKIVVEEETIKAEDLQKDKKSKNKVKEE